MRSQIGKLRDILQSFDKKKIGMLMISRRCNFERYFNIGKCQFKRPDIIWDDSVSSVCGVLQKAALACKLLFYRHLLQNANAMLPGNFMKCWRITRMATQEIQKCSGVLA